MHFSFGLKAAYSLLAESIVDADAEKAPGTFNILGASSGDYRCKADMLEIQRLMGEAFGMKCLCNFCLDTSIEAISKMGPRGADMIRESIDGYLNTLR